MKGGKRKGAGRKPRQTARKQVNLRLEPETKEKLDRICEAEDISQTERVTRWVDDHQL
jgi:predicted HicB family RNase H-like nuclease